MKIEKSVDLSRYTTFRIGGPAKKMFTVGTKEELLRAIILAKKNKEKIFILGGGSNVLFSDEGYGGVIIRLVMEENLPKILSEEEDIVRVACTAGCSLAALVQFSLKHALTGVEWAAGIPGTVGGAIRGNAGAYGGEMKELVDSVSIIDADKIGERLAVDQGVCNLKKEECGFAYRSSNFKSRSNLVISDSVLCLRKGIDEDIKKKVEDILSARREKVPNVGSYPSAGSVFKNPEVGEKVVELFEQDKELSARGNKVPAGWLIERCGLKGKMVGNAMISTQQANIIVNMGGATAKDVIMLMSIIKQKVRNTFGVQLQEEIEVVL
jgi:UDP-N-acetylmuramate dehydrogenase